jgi:hypothetical protein
MTFQRTRLTLLAVGLVALSTSANAQIAVRDDDGEARNAYQETCTTLQRVPRFASCNLPPLTPGKRLAIRYVAATCRETGPTRNLTMLIAGRIDSVTSATSGPVLLPKRVNSTVQSFYLLGEPIFLHSDGPPQLIATWEGDGDLVCITTTFGFLSDKK